MANSLPKTRQAEEINKRPDEYWTLVMDIARKNNLKRIMRCTQVGHYWCVRARGVEGH